ncbi:MAG TPA: DUF2917 domain-containing protein [Burkholderiales bacterium]|nr:DUF2917 domain-containing protein [Burkholderiales bacterium]
MGNHSRNPVIHLGRKQLLELRNARGTLIQCHRGTLWITQENDGDDVILKAGETFEIQRGGLTLASSLDSAAVSVAKPGAPECLTLRPAPRAT